MPTYPNTPRPSAVSALSRLSRDKWTRDMTPASEMQHMLNGTRRAFADALGNSLSRKPLCMQLPNVGNVNSRELCPTMALTTLDMRGRGATTYTHISCIHCRCSGIQVHDITATWVIAMMQSPQRFWQWMSVPYFPDNPARTQVFPLSIHLEIKYAITPGMTRALPLPTTIRAFNAMQTDAYMLPKTFRPVLIFNVECPILFCSLHKMRGVTTCDVSTCMQGH